MLREGVNASGHRPEAFSRFEHRDNILARSERPIKAPAVATLRRDPAADNYSNPDETKPAPVRHTGAPTGSGDRKRQLIVIRIHRLELKPIRRIRSDRMGYAARSS